MFVKTRPCDFGMIFLILIIVCFIRCGDANLTPISINHCNVSESCKQVGDQTTSGDFDVERCEAVCTGDGCALRVAVIMPKNTTYIVNIDAAKVELNKAIEHARDTNLLPNNLQVIFEYFDDRCEQSYTTLAGMHAYFTFCAHVIIGSTCDYAIAGIARVVKFLGHGLPLIMPGGFAFDFIANKTHCKNEFFMLVNSGLLNFQSISEFLFLIMQRHNWKHIALMYHKNDLMEVGGENSCYLLMSSLVEVMNVNSWGKDLHHGDMELGGNVSYATYLKETIGSNYGIIVLCASQENTREILLEAEKLKMTENGEYVFLNFDMYNKAPIPSRPWYNMNDTQENNERAKNAYKSLLTLTPWIEAQPQLTPASENATEAATATATATRGSIFLDGVYDGMLLFLNVARKLLTLDAADNVVANSTLPGIDLLNNMYGQTYKGKRENITINCNGQRVAKYAMLQLNNESNYHIVAEYSTLDKELVMLKDIVWVGGKIPKDIPECGYDNSKCKSQNHVLYATLLILILVVGALCGVVYRYYKIESEIDSMSWKIDPHDISEYFRTRKGSVATELSLDTYSIADNGQIYTSVVTYRGNQTAMKLLKPNKYEFDRSKLKQMKAMKDLSNDHIVKFYGACLEPSMPCVLTEYCPRGSLQDILENHEIKLDKHITYSLIFDIVRGMAYLHRSAIKSHGNLKSSNCLVDSRFVVKIADFGIGFLRKHALDYMPLNDPINYGQIHAFWEKQLWTAPELLRRPNPPFEGTQEGDVYSFAIILHEIIHRRGAFYLGEEKKNMTKKEIVETVKKGIDGSNAQPLRPHNEGATPEEVNLMQICWSENETDRPDFDFLKTSIRKINRGNGSDGNILDNLLTRMEQYANNLEQLVEVRTADYLDEKRKCEELLYQLLPKCVAKQLISGQSVIAESYDSVTIYFSDIVGFTRISAESTALEVVYFLNDLYTIFDSIIEEFDVYKVETIGDAYMVVSGLPTRNGNKHAYEIAKMALSILHKIKTFKIRHRPEKVLEVRIGIHTGSCVAGVIGFKMPRYCLFGDTVNTASRMETTCDPLRIHVSSDTKMILDTFQTFDLELRGDIDIKGKGIMRTYWLNGELNPETISNVNQSTFAKPIENIPLPMSCMNESVINNTDPNELNTSTLTNEGDEASIPLLSIVIPDKL